METKKSNESRFTAEEADLLVEQYISDNTLTLVWEQTGLSATWRFFGDRRGSVVGFPFPMEVKKGDVTGRILNHAGEGSQLVPELTDAINRYALVLLDQLTL